MFSEKHDLFYAHFSEKLKFKSVNFAKVLKKAQEPGNVLAGCFPDVNFKVSKEASQQI